MYFILHFLRVNCLDKETHLFGKVFFKKFNFDQFLRVDYSAFNALSLCGKHINMNKKINNSTISSTIFDFYTR